VAILPGGNPHTDVGTSRALLNFGYALNYTNYLFGGNSNGFPDNQ